jgi:hypothetical protein
VAAAFFFRLSCDQNWVALALKILPVLLGEEFGLDEEAAGQLEFA